MHGGRIESIYNPLNFVSPANEFPFYAPLRKVYKKKKKKKNIK